MSLAAIPRYDSDISGEKVIPIAIIRPAYRTVNHHSGVWAVKQRVGMVVIKHRLKPVQTNALIPWRSYKRPTTAPTKALTTAPGKRINPVSALDWWSDWDGVILRFWECDSCGRPVVNFDLPYRWDFLFLHDAGMKDDGRLTKAMASIPTIATKISIIRPLAFSRRATQP